MSIGQTISKILTAPAYLVGFAGGMRAAGYDAAVNDRRRVSLDWSRRTPKDEDRLVGTNDRVYIRSRCLDMMRNNPLAAGIVKRFSDNVVGTGIRPQAKTTDKKWNQIAEEWWGEWCKIADYRQRLSLWDMQRLAVQHRIWAGDLGFALMENGQIYPVEGERIATPDKEKQKENETRPVVDGVRVDSRTGIPLAFVVYSRDENGKIDTSKENYVIYPREDFVYLSAPFRFDQVRGLPELAPVVNKLVDLKEFEDATLQKAKLDSLNAWAITSATQGPGNLGARQSGRQTPGVSQKEKIEDGAINYLQPGEKMESLASNTPNSQYEAYKRDIERTIAQCLGVPYEMLKLDFSQTNYSNARAALIQTYKTFECWQSWLTRGMLQRLWNWRIAKAIKAGDLPPAPKVDGVSQWFRVEWSLPAYDWVDPQNQSQAELLDYQMGKTSLQGIVRRTGRDVEDVLNEKADEIVLASQIVERANKEGASMTVADLIKASIPGQDQGRKPMDNKQETDNANSETETE